MQILYTDSQNTYYRQSGFTLSKYSKCTVTQSVTINTFSKRLGGYQQAWSRRRGVDGGECKGYWGQENDPVRSCDGGHVSLDISQKTQKTQPQERALMGTWTFVNNVPILAHQL